MRFCRSQFWVVAFLSITVPNAMFGQTQQLVNNVFFQSDLRQALDDLSAQAGTNIIADPSVQGVVTATIQDKTVEDALQLLLAGTGYRVVERPDYFLVYSPDIQTDLFAEVSETEIITLRNVSANGARDLLVEPLRKYVRADTENRRLVVSAPAEILDIITADVDMLDLPNTDQTEFYALTHIAAESARELLPDRLQTYVRTDGQRNSISISGPASVRQETLELLLRLDRPLPPTDVYERDVYETVLIKLENTTVGTVMNLLPATFAEFVSADATSNSVAVNAPPAIAQQIHSAIAVFDSPREHIMLEARVVVLDTNAFLDLGTQFQPPGLIAGANRTNGTGTTYEIGLGYTSGRSFTNALNLTLNMLSENNRATIVASPQVLAQDGIESVIEVTTAEFFQILTSDNTFIRSELEEIETGTILRITPQIGRDQTLTLTMELEISDVVARGEQNLPVVNRRVVSNTVQIQSGGTAAVAGLSDARNQQGRRGIPGLLSIPILGRTDSQRSQNQQVAIFVTATLVGSDDSRFRTGRARPPSLGAVDEDAFRLEIENVLNSMGIE